MTTYLFTVPLRYRDVAHPLGATPDDLLAVEADTPDDARIHMNQTYGPETWFTCYRDDELTEEWRFNYAPGQTINAGQARSTA